MIDAEAAMGVSAGAEYGVDAGAESAGAAGVGTGTARSDGVGKVVAPSATCAEAAGEAPVSAAACGDELGKVSVSAASDGEEAGIGSKDEESATAAVDADSSGGWTAMGLIKRLLLRALAKGPPSGMRLRTFRLSSRFWALSNGDHH